MNVINTVLRPVDYSLSSCVKIIFMLCNNNINYKYIMGNEYLYMVARRMYPHFVSDPVFLKQFINFQASTTGRDRAGDKMHTQGDNDERRPR